MSPEQYVAAHTGGLGFDIVYDTVGGATLDASFNAVCRFGHVSRHRRPIRRRQDRGRYIAA